MKIIPSLQGVKSQGALLSHDKNLSVLRQLVLDTLDEKGDSGGEESSSSSSSTVLLAFDFDYTLKVSNSLFVSNCLKVMCLLIWVGDGSLIFV